MALDPQEAYKRLNYLKGKRQLWDSHWQELADYFYPNKNTILRTVNPGERKFLNIYDSTGIHANELLAGALHSMLTNPSSYWFEYTTGNLDLDKQDDVRKWLQDAGHITHEVMNGSNFQTEIHEIYMDEGVFGHGVMSVLEDDVFVVRFSAKPVNSCWLEENAGGWIDTIYYVYKWQARLIVQEFGEKNCPKWIMEAMEKNDQQEFELLQVIYPNEAYNSEKKLSVEGKKFVSCTYVKDKEGSETILEEKGFNTFPFVTPRWSKATGETYGRSPSMKTLADVKMINEMMKETIRAQQKATNPPMLVPDDGVIGSLKLVPGGITYFRSGSGDFIKPLESGANLQLTYEMMDDVRKRIRDSFYIDQLQLQEGPQMTATEVMQRTEEKIRLLGPLLGRQHSELLRPLIERVFEILWKKRIIPPPPRVLQGKKIDVKYRSMLAKAQLASEAQNISRAVQAAAPFLQLNQQAADVIDAEEGIRYAARLYGLPQEMLRTKDAVDEIRQARDQANQKMLEEQQNQQGVDQVAKLAPAAKIAHEMAGGGKPTGP